MLDFTPDRPEGAVRSALAALRRAVYTPVAPLAVTAWRTPEPVPFTQRTDGTRLGVREGDVWGQLFDCAWFHFTGSVPPEAAGRPVVLLLDVSGEMLVVDGQGEPVRGLTTAASWFDPDRGNPGKRVLPFATAARGGEAVDVWADAGCNDLFGFLQSGGTLREARIATLREDVRSLMWDVEVLFDSLDVLPAASARRARILRALLDAIRLLGGQAGIPHATPQQVAAAAGCLTPVLAERNGDGGLHLSAVGHAHIDLAWLWPLRETRRKVARTFATALTHLEADPGYVFAASQGQMYAWLKEDHPALYARVQEAVRQGRWEPQGALWVESDTNVPSGESLVRQILYGQHFFEREFGQRSTYVWLPDTFGYSAALPQIMRHAGLRLFSTQKLSWNGTNPFPYQSFHWAGLDGSRVLVHMPPEETYNSAATPRALAMVEENYRQKDVSNHAMLVYGVGDGGGGPGEEHLERLARLGDFAGLPRVTRESTAAFFGRWQEGADRFPVWAGELYLERHQGTLTTHAHNKRCNRRLESGLREWELWASAAAAHGLADYPAARLEAVWKEALLYQFHDILPGSSIKRVYDETGPRYAALLGEVEQGICAAQERLAAGCAQPVVFNSLPWERSEWLDLPWGWQQVTAPPMGIASVSPAETAPIGILHADTAQMENDCLRATFDAGGALVSLLDKRRGAELIPPGERANRLQLLPDAGDAWDFPADIAALPVQEPVLEDATAWVDGPHAHLRLHYTIGHTRIEQTMRLTAGSPRLEVTLRTDWRERRAMLRAVFPVNVHTTEASYEIQFGHIRRPTHTNTSWDAARHEATAHRWVDLSQRDRGLALLNDGTYGHTIKGHTILMTLLRSVPHPGPRQLDDNALPPDVPHPDYTDQCEHVLRYALYPHAGDPVASGVVQAGYAFNSPLRILAPEGGTGRAGARGNSVAVGGSFFALEAPTVILETVKRSEDGSGWILRLYEAGGGAVQTRLVCRWPVAHAEEVDLMEENGRALHLEETRKFRLLSAPLNSRRSG